MVTIRYTDCKNREGLTLTQEDVARLIALCVIVENTYASVNKLWNQLQLARYEKSQSGTHDHQVVKQKKSVLL